MTNTRFRQDKQTSLGIFQQIRGLAMGSRLSGTLATLAMDRFERNNIYDTIRPVVYSRYVDDIGTVVSSIPVVVLQAFR